MPKVSREYLEGKRNEIVDAAFEVCKRKPAYEVSMSDIVAQTGWSQGGVYKYFNNICSVYASMIDRANLVGDQIPKIDQVMAGDSDPKTKLQRLFGISESFFSDMLISYNKILFELATYCIQDPEADRKINGETRAVPVFPYLASKMAELIVTGAASGYFEPVVPVDDIIKFVVSSFDGIIRDVTLNRCYSVQTEEITELDEKRLISCLYISTLKLLGV
ncbi:MAG: TetR family transcriptional regulator [Clostridiales bacterium]|nr:TetR family transcriptional regulator [Clostridiales bacterium]